MEPGTEFRMEQSFSERLKRYRKERNLTQQQLADALGVSNKSVSRWESGGGYPDVPLLVPLARALGVTADDLLDAEKPVRALTRADWQGLLSFAFALGGGLLFYLLATFAPLLVCYAVYLACLCYGAYLQRYYARHSRWFWLGAAGMNLAVNWSAALELVLLVGMFVRLGPAVLLLQPQKEPRLESFWLALVLSAALALGATALTLRLLHRRFFAGSPEKLILGWHMPRGRALLPLFGFALLAGFWAIYLRLELPLVLWQRQGWLFAGLLAALALGYGLALKRKPLELLLAWLTLTMSGGVWWLRQLDHVAWVQSLSSGKLFEWNSGLNMEKYLPLIQPLPALFAVLAALAAIYLLAAGLTLRENKQSSEA
nr:helix-turn-helix transcriptional regulator [Fournierella massiliensis]